MVMKNDQKQRMFFKKGSVKFSSVVVAIIIVVIFGIKIQSLTAVGIVVTNIIVIISFRIILIFIKSFVGILILISIKIVIIIILKYLKVPLILYRCGVIIVVSTLFGGVPADDGLS